MVADVLAGVLVVGCAWEFGALTTGKYPTISHGMWRLPKVARAVVWGSVVVLLTDHFFTRRWT
jgi:hypothetical protein